MPTGGFRPGEARGRFGDYSEKLPRAAGALGRGGVRFHAAWSSGRQADRLFRGGAQFGRGERFGDVADRPHAGALDGRFNAGEAGDDDHLRGRLVAPQASCARPTRVSQPPAWASALEEIIPHSQRARTCPR